MNTTTATRNGWNTVTVETVSAATGVHRTYEAKFRNLRIEHCTGNVVTFDSEHLPFYIDGSYGELKDHARQCGGCGRMFVQAWTAREVSE